MSCYCPRLVAGSVKSAMCGRVGFRKVVPMRIGSVNVCSLRGWDCYETTCIIVMYIILVLGTTVNCSQFELLLLHLLYFYYSFQLMNPFSTSMFWKGDTGNMIVYY